MRSWLLTEDGDFSFDAGRNMQMVEGDDELLQAVRLTMTTNLGEWFLNEGFGFAIFDVLGERFDEQRTTDAVYACLGQMDDRVDSVEDVYIEFDRPARTVYITYVFTKVDDGETLSDTLGMAVVAE